MSLNVKDREVSYFCCTKYCQSLTAISKMLGRAPRVMHPAILITSYPTVVGNGTHGGCNYWVTQVDKAIAGAVPLWAALVWCAERFGMVWRGGGMVLAPSLPTQTAGTGYLGMASAACPLHGLDCACRSQLSQARVLENKSKAFCGYICMQIWHFCPSLPDGHVWF